MKLHLDPDQRFTCSQCGRCCRRPWEVVVTASEVELYENNNAARWYRESEDAPEGVVKDPFDTLPGGPSRFLRIRKREDGVCGFLSPQNRCRIHEELGEDRKPLTCRMFPYRMHPIGSGDTLVTTSFCCPTTVANEGAPLPRLRRGIQLLQTEWAATHSEKPRAVRLVRRRAIDAPFVKEFRSILRATLDAPGDDGVPDLANNLTRIAAILEDLSRFRVLRLKDERLLEYLRLTGWHAAKKRQHVAFSSPSRLARLLFRGFLFVVAATRVQAFAKGVSRWRLRIRLLRLLRHVHGFGAEVEGFDVRAMLTPRVDLQDPELHALAHTYLRATIQTLGTGRRSIVDELAVAVAYLHAACCLASMASAKDGKPVDAQRLTVSLMEAVDLTHADAGGVLGKIISLLGGGPDQLRYLAFSSSNTTSSRTTA